MPRNLSIASIAPAADTITMPSGETYTLRSSMDLSPGELAEVQRLSEGLQEAFRALRGDHKNPDKEAVVTKRLRRMLKILISGIPDEELQGLNRVAMNMAMEYWQNCEEAHAKERKDAVTTVGDDPGEANDD